MMILFKFLPQFIRIYFIRKQIKILGAPDTFEVKIATNQEELEKAYFLLHECYTKTNLMSPDPSGLRCNFYSFLPTTTTVIAKIGNSIVGTVSLIKDSPVGLPSDKDFKQENDRLRLNGRNLVEVSSLAIDSNYRKKSHVVSFYLMKYLQHYTSHYMGCTTVTCVVHPRARDFYAAVWGFKSNNKIIKYKFVNDALGVHVYGDITDDDLKLLTKKFTSHINGNPISFLFRMDKFLIYPQRKIGNHLDPVYTPELLNYFMMGRTSAVKNMSRQELLSIFSAYKVFFDHLEELAAFQGLSSEIKNRSFRFPCHVSANMTHALEESFSGDILDITPDGAFVATENTLEQNKQYILEFEIQSQQFSIPCAVIWQNRRSRNHQPLGYGVKFQQTQLQIAKIFKHTHLTAFKKTN